MLRYLSSGLRPFGDYPMPAHRRMNWEFYAVLDGQLAPLVEGGRSQLTADTLWVMPPSLPHGWTGEPGRFCDVAVYHFDSVPVELERRVRRSGWLAVGLTAAEKQQLRRLVAELTPHYHAPSVLSEYHCERALIDLSLLVLEKPWSLVAGEAAPEVAALVPTAPVAGDLPARAVARVLAAENWFRLHLAERPTLEEVARAGGLSAGHLRRLFHQVRGEGPHPVFEGIRIRHALQLLAHSDRKLAAVALDCGFAGASQLCQVFRSRLGVTPTQWRSHHYRQYRTAALQPGGPAVESPNANLLAANAG